MDDFLIRGRINSPVTTGIPSAAQNTHTKAEQAQPNISFRQMLEQTVQKQDLLFSKHAAERVAQREIELSETDMARLNEGLQIARDKGMEDALILMDGSAFIVSAKNSMVITALGGHELKGRVITNIDGTVIL